MLNFLKKQEWVQTIDCRKEYYKIIQLKIYSSDTRFKFPKEAGMEPVNRLVSR